MRVPPQFPLRVFYDGACSVCATEVEHYVRKDRQGHLILVDISAPDFDPRPTSIPLDDYMQQMHTIDRSGRVYRGIEAFWAIWQAFPPGSVYGLFGRLITLPVISGLARSGYRGFARIRRYLPKRTPHCRDDSCRIDRSGPRS